MVINRNVVKIGILGVYMILPVRGDQDPMNVLVRAARCHKFVDRRLLTDSISECSGCINEQLTSSRKNCFSQSPCCVLSLCGGRC